MARASGRRRELAIRSAIGAGRLRLISQLFTESLLLGAIGGGAGLLLGVWLLRLLIRVLPAVVPRASGIDVDPVVTGITVAASLAAGALFGVLPALQGSRANAAEVLQQAGGRSSSRSASGRAVLVVVEIALTLVLLTGAGLLLNSFLRLKAVDSGLQPEHVTVLELALPPSRYPDDTSQAALYTRLLEVLRGRPEVDAAGVGFPGPLRGSNASGAFFIEGRPSVDRSDRPFANLGSVSAGFFAGMGVPLVAGRVFADADGPRDPGVAIASVALASKYWPGETAVGKRVRFDDEPKSPWITIVGVVGDVRQLGLEKEPPPILYIPYRQFTLPFTNVVVRSRAPAGPVASLMRNSLTVADPALAPGDITALQDILDRSVDQPRFRTMLLGAFAAAALVLASVGVYGLVSYSVASRTREIGIRIALGARPGQVLIPLLRDGLRLALAGIAIGLAGAVAAGRLLASFLYAVSPGDPATLITVALLLLAVAVAACYIPCRRALRVDPIDALRVE